MSGVRVQLKARSDSILPGHRKPSLPILLVQFQDKVFQGHLQTLPPFGVGVGGRCVINSLLPVALQSQSEAIVFSSLHLPCSPFSNTYCSGTVSSNVLTSSD